MDKALAVAVIVSLIFLVTGLIFYFCYRGGEKKK